MLRPFFVWKDRKLHSIDPGKVLFLNTEGNYTRIYLANSFYMVRSSLSNALKKLPPDMFIKVHRSYVISIYHIDNISRDYLVINEVAIPIAKQYYKPLIEKLNIIDWAETQSISQVVTLNSFYVNIRVIPNSEFAGALITIPVWK